MNFHPCDRPLKIQESVETPIPQMGAHFRVWGFIPSHFSYTPGSMKCDSQASFLAYTFASPCLGREPKAKVMTLYVFTYLLDRYYVCTYH
jgi:hypothetical protein